jgi:hypothetical protein
MSDLIFGRTWEEIQGKQQRRQVAPIIRCSTAVVLHPGDLELLEKYGEEELKLMGYFGVLDRLIQTGHLVPE